MIQNCILNLYPLSALKCGPPGAKRSGFPLHTWVFAPRRGPSGQSVQRGGAAEGFRSFSDQPPRGHGVEPRGGATALRPLLQPLPPTQVPPPSHLRVPRAPACAAASSPRRREGAWPHLSRDRLPWPPPLLRAADWRRLRSRPVRLLCCGLGDGVCLREEETDGGGGGGGGGGRGRAPVARSHTNAARDCRPPARAAVFRSSSSRPHIVLSGRRGPRAAFPAAPLRGWISSSPQGGAGARGSPAV